MYASVVVVVVVAYVVRSTLQPTDQHCSRTGLWYAI